MNAFRGTFLLLQEGPAEKKSKLDHLLSIPQSVPSKLNRPVRKKHSRGDKHIRMSSDATLQALRIEVISVLCFKIEILRELPPLFTTRTVLITHQSGVTSRAVGSQVREAAAHADYRLLNTEMYLILERL